MTIYYRYGNVSLTESQAKSLLEKRKEEYLVASIKYDLSFWEKLKNGFYKPYYLRSFRSYLWDKDFDLYQTNSEMRTYGKGVDL